MSKEIKNLARKAGHPPGTPLYLGDKLGPSQLRVVVYNADNFQEIKSDNLEACLKSIKPTEMVWINIEGLQDLTMINKIAEFYHIHPLTLEDILNLQQRAKIEEFKDYCFVTLRMFFWQADKKDFNSEQSSLVFGKNFIISFQEGGSHCFTDIYKQLQAPTSRLRQQGSDYLAYRLVDTIVDQYFIVLEGLSDQLDKLEEIIIGSPIPKNSRTIYHLKRKVLTLRKAIWPIREAINRLLHSDIEFISDVTRLYLRDVYDHTNQAIDTLESFRDMLSGLLDMYLSSVSTRMNEIMKVLTIIATIFIPITFISSIYGMNFKYMPELQWRWGYPTALGAMGIVVLIMIIYFQRKRWL